MSTAQKHLVLGVIILAAGASSRMGRPKLLLPWDGKTVVAHLISQWQKLGAAQIAIVQRANDLPLTTELDRLNFSRQNRITNPHPERGMFSSIVCAANWLGWRNEISLWVIALGDQPHLREETLRKLLDFSALHRDAICQPLFNGKTAHPVILSGAAFQALKNTGAETLKDFLKLGAFPNVQQEMDDPGLALDLDTPEDYIQAQGIIPAPVA